MKYYLLVVPFLLNTYSYSSSWSTPETHPFLLVLQNADAAALKHGLITQELDPQAILHNSYNQRVRPLPFAQRQHRLYTRIATGCNLRLAKLNHHADNNQQTKNNLCAVRNSALERSAKYDTMMTLLETSNGIRKNKKKQRAQPLVFAQDQSRLYENMVEWCNLRLAILECCPHITQQRKNSIRAVRDNALKRRIKYDAMVSRLEKNDT